MRRVAWVAAGLMATAAPAAMAAAQEAPALAPAQEETPPAPGAGGEVDELGEEVVVTGQLRGAVPGDVKPELMLNPADIRAYGASNVGELIEQLAPQLGSGAGRGSEQPVILLSGRRSSMNEVRQLPSEAIERVDILPEEAALRYGYSATQKVINIVLRRRFQAVTVEVEGRTPTAGGNAGTESEINILKLNRNGRVMLDVQFEQNSGILESERGVTRAGSSLFDTRGNITGFDGGEIDPALSAAAGTIVTVAGVPDGAAGGAPTLGAFAANANRANVSDLTPYRTLVNPQRNLAISGQYNRTLSPTVVATANVRLEAKQSESLLGLSRATLRLPAGSPYSPFSRDVQLLRYLDNLGPLSRNNDSQALTGEFSINGDQSPWSNKWRWSVNGNYERSWSDTSTTTGVNLGAAQAALDARDPGFNPFAPIPLGLIAVRPSDTSSTRSSAARIDMLTNGPLFRLPAGEVNTSIRVAGTTRDLSGESVRASVLRESRVARDTASARGNVNLPLTSKQNGVLGALGDLSLTANFEVEQVSGFGRLTETGYGFNWRPISGVSLIGNWTNDHDPPTPEQLGDPVISTPNVRVFDFVRGESVDITRITGGNPLLRADQRKAMRLGAFIKPFSETDLTLNLSYSDQRYRNQVVSFPTATAEVEAAFPGRFVRDASGRLVSIDARPVNNSRRDQSMLRWGVSFGMPLPSPNTKRRQAEMAAFRQAMEESRRTGQPLPPEFTARIEEFRRMQQQSIFGGAQGGQRQGQPGGGAQAARQGPGQPGGARFGGPGGGGPGGRGGFGGRGGGGGGNTIRLNLNHTWLIKDEQEIVPGVVIDRLNGEAGSPTPAHRVQADINLRYDWLRANVRGDWRSGTRIASTSLGSTTVLDYDSLAKVNLEVGIRPAEFMDAGRKHPWLRGTQIELQVLNLFDARQRVTDQNGVTPASHLPDLLDPVGRVVQISFRKQLF